MKKHERLFEMSNLSTKKTGLDYIIWITPQSGKEKHEARIKIKIDNKFVSITIGDTPELKSKVNIESKKLNKIFDWIKLNKNILLKYWNGKGNITIDEILDDLKKVK
jgi:F420-dependent methylenetetrahydromethanopterin dehydrogenase